MDDVLRQPWDVRQDAVPARGHGVIERIRHRRIAEDGEEFELEQVLVRQLRQRLERLAQAIGAAVGVVVVEDRALLGRHLADELFQLHPD
jgi:hypothetical protein